MTDFERLEDKASLYIMGDMTDPDRREFEAQRAESAELAQLVRELEDGVTAVGLACPPRRPPPFLWRGIEQAIEHDRRKIIPVFGPHAWRNAGWAAAAACLAAWLFFVAVQNQTASNNAARNSAATNSLATDTAATALANAARADEARRTAENAANQIAKVESKARAREEERLRNDVSNLQRRLGEMSQVLTQQQAMLGEPNRLKFLTLTPAANAAPLRGLSPEVQRALFLAMARELGWLNSTNQMSAPFQDPAERTSENMMNVDLVDFRASTNGAVTRFHIDKPKDSNASAQTQDTNLGDASTDNPSTQLASLPAFVSGDDVVVALDNTIASAGSQVSFTVHSGGEATALGSTTMGSDSMVIIFHNRTSAEPWTLQLTTNGSTGPGFLFFTPAGVSR